MLCLVLAAEARIREEVNREREQFAKQQEQLQQSRVRSACLLLDVQAVLIVCCAGQATAEAELQKKLVARISAHTAHRVHD